MQQHRLTFYCSGHLGDIIYSLPAVVTIMRKQQAITCTYITGLPIAAHWAIESLLYQQPYITEVHHVRDVALPQHFVNLDQFRLTPYTGKIHIVNQFRRAFELCDLDLVNQGAWLAPMTEHTLALRTPYAVVNVTGRYRDKFFNWNKELKWLQKQVEYVLFLGLHEEFLQLRKDLKHSLPSLRTHYLEMHHPTLLEAAKVINGAAYFSGTQSSLLAIRQGLGLPYRFEQSPNHADVNQYSSLETVLNKRSRKLHKFAVSIKELMK